MKARYGRGHGHLIRLIHMGSFARVLCECGADIGGTLEGCYEWIARHRRQEALLSPT